MFTYFLGKGIHLNRYKEQFHFLNTLQHKNQIHKRQEKYSIDRYISLFIYSHKFALRNIQLEKKQTNKL